MILYQETAAFIRGSDKMKECEKVLVSLGLDMDVVVAAPESPVIGKTIDAIERQSGGSFYVVQINRRGGEAVARPDPETVIEAGDGLFLVGRGARAQALGELFGARRRRAFRLSTR